VPGDDIDDVLLGPSCEVEPDPQAVLGAEEEASAEAAIHDLNDLVGSTHRLVDSDGAGRLLPHVTTAIDDVETMGEAMIDRVFHRALLFLLIALVGLVAARLAYRWLETRCLSASVQ
jgi:hypothetical protein